MPSDIPNIQNLQASIEELLLQNSIDGVMTLINACYQEGLINIELAEWLLKKIHHWYSMGFIEEQQFICKILLNILPGNYELIHLLGFLAQLQGQHAMASKYYEHALALKPDYAFSKLAHAQMRMLLTNFAEGRSDYESRFDAVTEASGPDWRGLPIERWHGELLNNKHLYLWAEQGLGDIIMFASFLHYLLEQSPKRLVLGMFPKLITLFSRSFPSVIIEPIDDAANHALAPTMQTAFPHIEKLAEHTSMPFSLEPLRKSYDYVMQHGLFDIAAPMGDMLVHYALKYTPAKHQNSYLVADSTTVASTRKKLKELGQGRCIGISWHTQNIREITRNIPLREWLPVFKVSGCHFISLQHGIPKEEIERFCQENSCKITIYPDLDLTQDAEGLAALIAAMDEVITIDNSNVHLAGALGVATKLLLPKGYNYRWPVLTEGATRWYKTVSVIRQQANREWGPVIEEVGSTLRQKLNPSA